VAISEKGKRLEGWSALTIPGDSRMRRREFHGVPAGAADAGALLELQLMYDISASPRS
jgi:hypothetical protein